MMENGVRLIDANALAKDLESLAKHEDSFRQSVILGVVHTVKVQPTVDAVPVVHGHWVKYNFFGPDQFACSECQTHGSPQWKRCPVCEAKMDGDGDG